MATNAENLQTIISNSLAALAADSASPQPSYSINGKSVSRDQWRESLMRQVKEAREVLNLEEFPEGSVIAYPW